jgi:hypothetical protein
MPITTGRVVKDPGERGLAFEADDGQTHRTMNIGFTTLERQSNRSINGAEEAIHAFESLRPEIERAAAIAWENETWIVRNEHFRKAAEISVD